MFFITGKIKGFSNYIFALIDFFIGSRGAAINLEARSLSAKNLMRRCAVIKASEFSIDLFQKALQNGLSAILIILPASLDEITDYDLQVKLVSIQYLTPI